MQRPVDIATEFTEVQQARVQEGWGNPQVADYKAGLRVEVSYSKAPSEDEEIEQGSSDPIDRDGKGWTFKLTDPSEEVEDGKELTVIAEETDRHVFGLRLAEAWAKKVSLKGKSIVEVDPEAEKVDPDVQAEADKRAALDDNDAERIRLAQEEADAASKAEKAKTAGPAGRKKAKDTADA